MSKISGKETKPEILVRKYLFSKGFRYRKNVPGLPGKPDIVLPKFNTIIFVHGCFWHGHKGCKRALLPSTNLSFWKEKINKTIERDKTNEASLKKSGWKIINVWQCELNNKDNREQFLKELIVKIKEPKPN